MRSTTDLPTSGGERSSNFRADTRMPTLDADLAEVADEVAETADPELTGWGLTVAELTVSSCRWPSGDPRDLKTFRYCGETAHDGPYCERHAGRAYVSRRAKA
jgi:hypothetical protein